MSTNKQKSENVIRKSSNIKNNPTNNYLLYLVIFKANSEGIQ